MALNQRSQIAILGIILMLLFIYLKIIYFPRIDSILFVDFQIYKCAFQYYPDHIYEYYWFVYTPAFFIQFYWINLVSLPLGLIIWFLLHAVIIYFTTTYFLSLVSKEHQKYTYIGFVLIFGMYSEIFVANTDIFLLAFGLLAYYYSDKNAFLTGIFLALGLFKPQFIVWIVFISLISKHRFRMIMSFVVFFSILNFQFIIEPSLIFDFYAKIRDMETLVDKELYFTSPIMNKIWRNGFSPPRQLISLFPLANLVILKLSDSFIFVKKYQNEILKLFYGLLLSYYLTGYIIYLIYGMI